MGEFGGRGSLAARGSLGELQSEPFYDSHMWKQRQTRWQIGIKGYQYLTLFAHHKYWP